MCVRIEDYSATSEASIKSGGRQPAVVRESHRQHLQWREFFPERVRSRTTGGLRPPLLAACADVIADTRFAPTGTLILPRLAYASRSWLHDATLTAKSDIVDGHTHTHEERRVSARRGNGVEPWMVNRNSPTGSRTHQERRASGRRGERNASAMARVFPGASTFAQHGGLTPPALGGPAKRTFVGETTTCAMHERSFPKSGGRQPAVGTKRICNGASFSRSEYVRAARGLTPPALGGSAGRTFADETAACAMHERSFPKSGGCQPAVV
jgi:hypothetical protein